MEKRYDHTISEARLNQKWEDEQTYKSERHEGQLWSVDTPPPSISGSLHIGHIFSYTHTDIIARYKRMSNHSVFYPFGFDDNGLPTEKFVEKKCGVSSHKMGRSAFISLCLEETAQAAQEFKKLWQKMGISADWDACYSTISKQTQALSQASFIDLVQKGYIYRKHEPALYCTACRTSVAQAELDDALLPSVFYDIVFTDETGAQLIIGTTRPELLPSCVAVFYHPDDARYNHLKNKQALVPIFGNTVPLLPDTLVDREKGTGLVMCCTFGDKTDIQWFKKHNLPYKQSIGFDGVFVDQTGLLAGLKVKQAREKVVEALKEQRLVLKEKPLEHTVSVHERCKKEIEYVTLAQWFLNILDYKQEFLALADQINWYPTFMKSRYIDWVSNLKWDWCLSRQRFYGIPFPVWHVEGTDQFLVPPKDCLPVDPQETEFPSAVPKEFEGKRLIPDTDVMDTWNTSSLTPYICYELFKGEPVNFEKPQNPFFPMSMRPQAHDIIRTWAFYTIVKSWMHNKHIPWKDIVISGHVLADNKSKLSKSKSKPFMSPENLLKQYPADVIRYWTASGNLGHDVSFSENQLKIGNRLVTKIWNAFRFVKDHISEAPHEQPKHLGCSNEWLLHELTQTFEGYKNYLDAYEFGLALAKIESFFWHTFCDNYLELIKDQLFNPEHYDQAMITATRWTLRHAGLRILQLYAPYLPFVTDSIYEEIFKHGMQEQSIHATKLSDYQTPFRSVASHETMQIVLEMVTAARKLKTEEQLSLRTELETVTIIADAQIKNALLKNEALFKGVIKASQVMYEEPNDLESSYLEKRDGTWHAVIVAV